MKKKLFSCILLAVFACVALFSFAACSSDQNVSDRLDALESDMDTLEAKVEALEAANANFQQQLAALDTSSDSFADDLAELTSNYNSLTASVQNATKIERVVLTMNDITSHDLIKDIWIAPSISNSSTVYLSARVEYKVSVFPYNLATCKVILTKDSETSTHYITFAKANNDESGALVSGYSTNVPANSESNMSAKWDELILYRFI